MSHQICKNAIYKNNKVYADHKCNNDTEPYHRDEFELEEFIGYVVDGVIQLRRTPKSKLERVIDGALNKLAMPSEDWEFDGGRVIKYILTYKSGLVVKHDRESYWKWRDNYKSMVFNYVKERV